MSFNFRSALLLSTGAAALLAGLASAEAQSINGGGSTLATPAYVSIIQTDLPLTPSFSYYTSGSGAAQTAFLTNTISAFGSPGVTSAGGVASGTGAVDFGASDATLTTAQISTFSSTFHYPLIQVPSFGTPITLAFNVAGKTGNGSVTLADTTNSSTAASVCGVLSGKITDWHDVDSTIPANSTIEVIFRADNSGTSFLLTQHLTAVCNSTNSSFVAANLKATQNFASLFTTLPANFHGASLSPGVEAAVTSTPNAIGYLSPDFTRIAFDNITNTAFPPVLSVSTAAGSFTPTTTNTTLALGTSAPIPTSTAAANPANWIPVVAAPTNGYPIVGYTTIEASSCYASTTTANGVIEFLDALYDATGTSPDTTSVANFAARGFVPLPGASAKTAPTTSSFAAAVVSNFLSGTGPLRINNTTCPTTGGR
jgi:phosphate transport system substrate-binding protein